jgi:hypothetical protein
VADQPYTPFTPASPQIPTYWNDDGHMREILAEQGITEPERWQCPCCENYALFGIATTPARRLCVMISMTFFEHGDLVLAWADALDDITNLPDGWPNIDGSILRVWYGAGLEAVLRERWNRGQA